MYRWQNQRKEGPTPQRRKKGRTEELDWFTLRGWTLKQTEPIPAAMRQQRFQCPDEATQHKAARRLVPPDCAGGRGSLITMLKLQPAPEHIPPDRLPGINGWPPISLAYYWLFLKESG